MVKNIVIGALAVVAVVLGGLYLAKPAVLGGASGTEHYFQENFYGGYTVGSASYTPVTGRNCATATWNPASTASSTGPTSLDIALTGAVMGDTCSGSLTSATSSNTHVVCDVSATATGTIKLSVIGASAIDLATGTAKVCFTH